MVKARSAWSFAAAFRSTRTLGLPVIHVELFRHLRVAVMIAWVFAWNAVLLFGMWLGGQGFSYKSVSARIALLVALWGTATLALAIARSTKIQAATLKSRENIPGLRKELWFIAVVTLGSSSAILLSFATHT
jgi:hypothetical protein